MEIVAERPSWMLEPDSPVLIVRPVGQVPWCPAADIADALRAEGLDARVAGSDGEADIAMPAPRSYVPGAGLASRWMGGLAADRVRAYATWLRDLRRLLRSGGYRTILVWDPWLAVWLRGVRPRHTRVVWTPPMQPRSWLGRLWLKLVGWWVDELVLERGRSFKANLGRQIAVAAFDGTPPRASAALATDPSGWLLVLAEDPSPDDVAHIEARARHEAPRAILVDARSHLGGSETADVMSPRIGRAVVDCVTDDAWLDRWNPADVVAVPSPAELDHRHRAAIDAGRLVVRTDQPQLWMRSCTLVDEADGWSRVLGWDVGELRAASAGAWSRGAVRPHWDHRAQLLRDGSHAIDACPACGSADRVLERGQGVAPIYRCSTCDLLHSGLQVSDDRFLPAGYFDGSGEFGTNYVDSAWFLEAICADRLDFLERSGVRTGTLLDIGAATGDLVAAARDRGWTASGLELSPAAAALAKEIHGVTLDVGSVDGFRPAERFDVVTLTQTLEHFRDARSVLATIRDHVLRSGGVLLIDVPNHAGLSRRSRGPRWGHWATGDHVSYFTPATLRSLLEREGWNVTACESFGGLYSGFGAFGVAFALGIVQETRLPDAAARAVIRSVRARRRGPHVPLSAPAQGTLGGGRLERRMLQLSALVDRAGMGDYVRALATAP